MACVVALAVPAQAQVPRVVVTAPSDASALLEESLVRAQGELSAVGLGAEVELGPSRHGPPRRGVRLREGVYGLLELEQRGTSLWIHAWAPGASAPIDARVDLAGSGVTSEVIAVRAVETLRAAMLQFAEAERGAVPDAVRGFTRFASPAAGETRAEPDRPPLSAPLEFWAGPAVSLHAGVPPDLEAQVGVLAGPSRAFAAAAFETTLGDLHLEGEHGSADVRRRAAWLQLGVRFALASGWGIATRAGVGYVAFGIAGNAEPGYHATSITHGSIGLMLGVSGTYWATRQLGLYGSVGGRLATDAPTVLIAQRQAVTLERPSFVFSLGVSVGVL
jgi:hypothetical protein